MLDNRSLHQVLPFLKEIDKGRREQFETYFSTAPAWLMDSFRIVELDKNMMFIREGAPADTIYFVGKGMVKATDYRVYGIAFDFTRLEGTYAMGGMEVLMDIDTYLTTIQTIVPTTMLSIPRDKFARWLKSDIKALKQEAKNVTGYLYEQGQRSRAYLFLQGSDRLALLLVDMYKKYARNNLLNINSTRQELADSSGLCVKTVSRAMKKFAENNWICRTGNRFTMTRDQFKQLQAMVSKLIEQ